MSGGNAEKRRIDEIFDFKNVTPVKYVTGERTKKCEMEWDVLNFLTALEMSSDADSPGDGKGPGIRMTFESGNSVSLIQMKDFRWQCWLIFDNFLIITVTLPTLAVGLS
jgi:hypothetical protein